ncbi:carbohydrate binding protein [Pontibacter ummariensis]|uniref:endo-1,4-beta-xylanase n=1 Tax=Pontibacter ummariensis TaxID=1610492 RepID=A0A239K252_9BACT|nr:endo-1,4-beta-xylanase [Pontibacter ummariensis]PRY06829.1 carbohydrate binding protein [Pontibacter ummariensis]SNT11858.1 Carbohydrate binding domain-containing protein [Pontibacter ummariensis]
MKHLYKVLLCVSSLVVASSCDDDPLEFEVKKPASFAQQEEINAYGDLKTYVDRDANPAFQLGAGVSLTGYTQKGVLYRLINSNFDEITPAQGMSHGAVVQPDGSLNLGSVKSLLSTAEKAGTTIFGSALAWHRNQNATYLNGLLSPLVVESPPFANALDVSSLTAGTLEGWTYSGGGASVSVVENEGMGGGVKAVKLTASAQAAAPEDLQLVSPEIPVVPGHAYEVVFYIKSDLPGEGRVAFEGLGNNTPEIDWTNSGEATETFTTNLGWKEVRFRISDFEGDAIKLHFDLGYAPGVTYHLDINNLYVYDTQGEPIKNNLIANGDFESGTGWGGWGNGSTRGVTEDGKGAGNKGRAFYVTNPSTTSGYWGVQTSYELAEPLKNGETYNLSFWVKGDAEGVIRPELQSPSYASNGFGMVNVTREWKLVNISTTVTAADRSRFIISYGEFAGTVYLDNVSLSSASLSGGTTTVVQRTPEEKTDIIAGQLEHWISGVVTSSAPYIKAWDVVNEPMDDIRPNELKTGTGKTGLATDEFYWQDYLGKDYGVKAFQLARKYGNEGDLLFINDNNLESNLDKTRGLIQYVSYLESKGAKVDGIGTQMHISTSSSKESIAEMFTLLAATGKLIRVSELNVSVGVTTDVASEEDYKAQEEMYRYVVEKYMELIPAGQRYGITVWSPLDSPKTASWRANEPIGLWTEGFVRKPAYPGVANGLGGQK